jgi:phage tail-like protein
MAVGTGPTDPFLSPWFAVEFQGQVTGAFRECSGLGSENEIVEHKAASKDGRHVVKKIPGNLKWTNITLKQGITDDMDMWKWRKMIEEGKVEQARKNGSIVLFSHAGVELARWNFVNAWPSKINGPSVNATSNEVAIEELEISHEGYERVL